MNEGGGSTSSSLGMQSIQDSVSEENDDKEEENSSSIFELTDETCGKKAATVIQSAVRRHQVRRGSGRSASIIPPTVKSQVSSEKKKENILDEEKQAKTATKRPSLLEWAWGIGGGEHPNQNTTSATEIDESLSSVTEAEEQDDPAASTTSSVQSGQSRQRRRGRKKNLPARERGSYSNGYWPDRSILSRGHLKSLESIRMSYDTIRSFSDDLRQRASIKQATNEQGGDERPSFWANLTAGLNRSGDDSAASAGVRSSVTDEQNKARRSQMTFQERIERTAGFWGIRGMVSNLPDEHVQPSFQGQQAVEGWYKYSSSNNTSRSQ